jgi:PilZ domain
MLWIIIPISRLESLANVNDRFPEAYMAQIDSSQQLHGPRAVRLEPPRDLRVTARTLGTRYGYDVAVANLSRSGLLLEWRNDKQTLPFVHNTLIEIELMANYKGQPRKINCFGKVVRLLAENGAALYGVKMIHTDDQEHFEWQNIIANFEMSLPQV